MRCLTPLGDFFAKYFSKAETGIKQSFIDKYWKGN